MNPIALIIIVVGSLSVGATIGKIISMYKDRHQTKKVVYNLNNTRELVTRFFQETNPTAKEQMYPELLIARTALQKINVGDLSDIGRERDGMDIVLLIASINVIESGHRI